MDAQRWRSRIHAIATHRKKHRNRLRQERHCARHWPAVTTRSILGKSLSCPTLGSGCSRARRTDASS
jgi:hypothetical protein